MKLFLLKVQQKHLNLVANTLGQNYLQEGDEILITELEHHSNYVPWHFLRKSKI